MTGRKLLLTRRSIRNFKKEEVPQKVLWKIFEICRFSPTSKNCQSYYYIVIKNKEIINFLANIREYSYPLKNAPMAVAICVDTNKTKRVYEDGHIAAYHFMLAAWYYGIGTCWIAGMDRDDVKEKINIPKEHYIATITPIGYPEFIPQPPPRRKKEEMVKFIY